MRRRVNQEICLTQDDKVSRTEGCEILEFPGLQTQCRAREALTREATCNLRSGMPERSMRQCLKGQRQVCTEGAKTSLVFLEHVPRVGGGQEIGRASCRERV